MERITAAQILADDRMAQAVQMINAELTSRRWSALREVELAQLRDRYGYGPCLTLLEAFAHVDLSEARALLHEWHTWRDFR